MAVPCQAGVFFFFLQLPSAWIHLVPNQLHNSIRTHLFCYCVSSECMCIHFMSKTASMKRLCPRQIICHRAMCAQVVASVVDAEIKASHVLSDCVSYIWAATDTTMKPWVFTWSETDQYSSLYKEIRFLFVINGRKKTKAEESSHVALCTYVRRRRARRRNYGSKQARDTKREVILFRNRP